MQKLELQWKEGINVDLEAVDAKLKAEHSDSYKCNQAASCLELWFAELPSLEEQEAIQNWWNDLDETSDEVLSYRSQTQINACIETLKNGIPAKTWNQLTTPERKMVLGQSPSKADLIAAELL